MRSTATKIPDAAYVHQRIDIRDKRYPKVPLDTKFVNRADDIRIGKTYSRRIITLMAPTPTIGSRQYPRTEATRYASIPWSDIRFRRVYIDADPKRPTPYI